MHSCHCVLPLSPDADRKPKSEQATAASSPPGGTSAEPSTSQPPKTEEPAEKMSDKPAESKVHRWLQLILLSQYNEEAHYSLKYPV